MCLCLAVPGMAQFISIDSAISQDPFVHVRFDAPMRHNLSTIHLVENGRRITGYIPPDTTTRDRQSYFLTKTPGTYTYQFYYQKASSTPCTQCYEHTNGLRVQVGPTPCTKATFLAAGQTGIKNITFTWGICPSCSSYTVTYRRINSNNPAIKPLPDQNVLASGDRFTNLAPTAAENLAQIMTRSSSTSFDGWWYQVDLRCNGSPSTDNRQTAMVFVAP